MAKIKKLAILALSMAIPVSLGACQFSETQKQDATTGSTSTEQTDPNLNQGELVGGNGNQQEENTTGNQGSEGNQQGNQEETEKGLFSEPYKNLETFRKELIKGNVSFEMSAKNSTIYKIDGNSIYYWEEYNKEQTEKFYEFIDDLDDTNDFIYELNKSGKMIKRVYSDMDNVLNFIDCVFASAICDWSTKNGVNYVFGPEKLDFYNDYVCYTNEHNNICKFYDFGTTKVELPEDYIDLTYGRSADFAKKDMDKEPAFVRAGKELNP